MNQINKCKNKWITNKEISKYNNRTETLKAKNCMCIKLKFKENNEIILSCNYHQAKLDNPEILDPNYNKFIWIKGNK